MAERPVDHAWEALVTATNANVTEERGALNRALSQIREQSPKDMSGDELGHVIAFRANLYRELWPAMSLTATALAKHWSRLPVEHERMREHYAKLAEVEAEKNRSKATNQSVAPSECQTCGGDRFVTVRLRKPQQTMWMRENQHPKGHQPHVHESEMHEEVAPCPSCNADLVVEYWIPGHHFRSMDAAQTREAMSA